MRTETSPSWKQGDRNLRSCSGGTQGWCRPGTPATEEGGGPTELESPGGTGPFGPGLGHRLQTSGLGVPGPGTRSPSLCFPSRGVGSHIMGWLGGSRDEARGLGAASDCYYLAFLLGLPFPLGFPGGSADKESPCNVGDLRLTSELGRAPGEGTGYPRQSSGLEKSMDYIVYGVTESDTTEQLPLLFQKLVCEPGSL